MNADVWAKAPECFSTFHQGHGV